MAQSSTALGPLVRLEGISIVQLPESSAANRDSVSTDIPSAKPSLLSFITKILTEAIPFIDDAAPKSRSSSIWKAKGSPKRYSSSEATVAVSEWVVPGKDIDGLDGRDKLNADAKDETWFCRRSCHRDAAEKGTANWAEFVHSFKENHPQSEKAFTPAVLGAREAQEWDTRSIEVEVHGGRWIDITLKVVEMKHNIPTPLRNRVFPVLQLAASLAGVREFIVVSIPISDFAKSPNAKFSNEKNVVVGAYVSIERVRVLPKSGEIEWIMATASNAKGVLPQWMQNMAVPGKVPEDVELFMAWIPTQRKGNEKPIPVRRSSTFNKSLPAAPVDTASLSTVPPPPISKTAETPPPVIRSESWNKTLPAAPKE